VKKINNNFSGGLFLNLGVHIAFDSIIIGFFDNNNDNDNGMAYGNFFIFDNDGKLLSEGFSEMGFLIGIKIDSVGDKSYYSLIGEHINLSESEYRKQLFKIRTGMVEEPLSYKFLSMKLPDNWGEILKDDILKFDGGEKVLEYYFNNNNNIGKLYGVKEA